MTERKRKVGKFDSEFNTDELKEEIAKGTIRTADSGDIPIFTAGSLAKSFNDGEYTTKTVRKYLNQLQSKGEVKKMEVNTLSKQPMTLWYSIGVEFDIDREKIEDRMK